MASPTQFNERNKTIYQTLKFYKSNHTIQHFRKNGATFPQKKTTQNSCFFAMLFNFCLHFPSVFIIKTVDNQFRYCNLILFERTKDFCKTIFARATTTFSMLTVRYIVSILLIPVILKCFTAVKFSNCSNHKVLLRAFLSLAA